MKGSIDTMGMRCIGVDVGGTSVKIGLFEITGELLNKWEVKIRKEEGGMHVLPDVVRPTRTRMGERGLSLKTDPVGIGLGVPGPVMPGGFVEIRVNLGWHRVNPQRELSCLLDGVTAESGNDANVAALGEMRQGGGRGYEDLVMITLGIGVGGGVITDEKITAGRYGLGGEIGHIRIRNEEWEHCNCGGVDCTEQICSVTGIAREVRRKMKASDKPSVLWEYGADATAEDVLDAAKAGDELANGVTDVVGHYLGLALSMVVMIVDPEILAIGGGVSKAGQFLIDIIQRHHDYLTPISEYKDKLGLTTLENDAGIHGAAGLVLQGWYCKAGAIEPVLYS